MLCSKILNDFYEKQYDLPLIVDRRLPARIKSTLVVLCGLTQSIYERPFPRCSPPYIREALISLQSASIAAHRLQIHYTAILS